MKIILKSTLLFAILFFTLTSQAQIAKVLDEVSAVVGDKIILKSYIEEQRVQMLRQRYYSDKDLRCEILEDQLYTKLLTNQAEIDTVEVGDRDIENELERRLSYFIGQLGSEEKVEEFFSKSIIDLKEEFRGTIRDQMISQKMQHEITQGITVIPTEVRRFYDNLSKDSIPTIPTTYEFQKITKYPVIDEMDVLEVKTRLEEFKKRISEGDNFASLAVLYSADVNTAKRGGELGYVGRGDLVPEFATVAFKLQKNEVSRIVKTEYGYHIIQMIDRKGERINARHILLKPKIKIEEKNKARNFLDSVRALIMADSISFDDAVAKFTDDKETRNGGGYILNLENNSIRFTQTQVDAAIAYAIKENPEGYITEPFESIDASNKPVLQIIKIRKKIDSHKANLAEDYTHIQEMALEKKKEEHIGTWIKDKKTSTYIRVAKEFHNCDFQYPWIQTEE
ncbi:MAG: peptidylprolyl isomerase [Salinivirgaceae bacterium]|nr:peptidylprolyl isomerase [Salinivirgaceae bacterium]MDD4746671.1 peptidylprolyl isomerase [Salinivirgaceae bacterium]MDY0281030.1 peptidylprolyl isomerase [Salinivirgaceae bacterium]